jgi:hypothetical protein
MKILWILFQSFKNSCEYKESMVNSYLQGRYQVHKNIQDKLIPKVSSMSFFYYLDQACSRQQLNYVCTEYMT